MAFVYRAFHELRMRTYDFAWIAVFDFLFGAVNALVIRGILTMLSTQYHLLNLKPPELSFTIFIGSAIVELAVLLIIPLILSIMLWQFTGSSYLVPPLHIQLVSSAIWITYVVVQGSLLMQSWILPLAVYGFLGGFIQDRMVVDLLGRKGSIEDVVSGSIMVNADIRTVKEVLLNRRFRFWLVLRKDAEETDRGYLLELVNYYLEGYVELERHEDRKDRTFVNVAICHYDRWRYHLAPRSSVEQHIQYVMLALTNLFQRNDPPIALSENRQAHIHTQFVRDRLVDDLTGRIARTREISTWKWLGLAVSFLLWITSAILFFEGYAIIDVVSTIGIALYASYETAGLFKRGRE